MVIKAGAPDTPDAHAALARLCETYWYPLYAFVRRQGWPAEDARDLTQAFFAFILSRNALGQVHPDKGRFRSFLMASMKHFLANEWDKQNRLKRGGGADTFSLDAVTAEERYRLEPLDAATPEAIFERRWAESVIAQVVERLRAVFEADGQKGRFEVLKDFLMGDPAETSYADAATRLGLSVSAVTSAIHRLRAQFREVFRDEIAQTVATPDQVDGEIRELLAALG